MTTTMTDEVYLGIDGGGSKCRAILVSGEGEVLGRGIAGPSNPFFGIERAIESVLAATDLAMAEAGLGAAESDRIIAGIGLAGVNLPRLYDALAAYEYPFRETYITTDLHIACLGAHGDESSAIVIVGTGSSGYSGAGDKPLYVGGHGFPLGDKGSGAWIGLEATRAVLLALDELGQSTLLSEYFQDEFQVEGYALVESLRGATSGNYAKVAPLVFRAADKNDPIAQTIVRSAAAYIGGLARSLFQTEPARTSMIGGLADPLMPWLDRDIADQLSPPLESPEFGAIRFARSQVRPVSLA